MTLTRPLIRYLSEARALERQRVTIDTATRFASALHATFIAQRHALERDTRARGWTGTLTEAHSLSHRQWNPYLQRILMGVDQDQRAAIQKYGLRALSSGVRRLALDVGVGISFDLDDPRAVNWMRTHGADLVTRINETTRDRIARVLERATEDGLSWRELTNDLRSSFGFSYARAKMIARTETANAFAEGNLVGARKIAAAGIRTQKSWLTNTPEDHACIGNGDVEWIDIEDAFPSGHMRPPAHPNCECDLVFRTVEQEKTKTIVSRVSEGDDPADVAFKATDYVSRFAPGDVIAEDEPMKSGFITRSGTIYGNGTPQDHFDILSKAGLWTAENSVDVMTAHDLVRILVSDQSIGIEIVGDLSDEQKRAVAQLKRRAEREFWTVYEDFEAQTETTDPETDEARIEVPLIPDIPDEAFAGQAAQFDKKGPPGISYFKGVVSKTKYVDTLLYRDDKGKVVGILYHYPFDFGDLEKKGNVNTLVHPKNRRQGIGTALLDAAIDRWKVDLTKQQYTRAGAALANAVLKNKVELTPSFAPLPRLPKAGDADERPALEDRLRERDRQSIVKAMGAPTFPDRKVGVWRTDDPFLAGYGGLGKPSDQYGFYAEMKLRGYSVRLIKDIIVVFPQRYANWNDPELADLRDRLEKRRAGSQVRWEIFKAAGYDAPHIRELERLRKLGAIKTGPRVKPTTPTPFIPFAPVATAPYVKTSVPPLRDEVEAFGFAKRKIDPPPALLTRGEAETWLRSRFKADQYARSYLLRDAVSDIEPLADMTAMRAGLHELDRLSKLFPKVASSMAAVSTWSGARVFPHSEYGTGEIAAVTRPVNANLTFQIMNMNPKYWGNPGYFQLAISNAVHTGFFPPGNDQFASNVTHEWGHAIDNFLTWHENDVVQDGTSRTVFDITAKYLSKIKDLQNAHEISRYASIGGSAEAFAEAFRSLVWTPTAQLSPQALALRDMLGELEVAGVFK